MLYSSAMCNFMIYYSFAICSDSCLLTWILYSQGLNSSAIHQVMNETLSLRATTGGLFLASHGNASICMVRTYMSPTLLIFLWPQRWGCSDRTIIKRNSICLSTRAPDENVGIRLFADTQSRNHRFCQPSFAGAKIVSHLYSSPLPPLLSRWSHYSVVSRSGHLRMISQNTQDTHEARNLSITCQYPQKIISDKWYHKNFGEVLGCTICHIASPALRFKHA